MTKRNLRKVPKRKEGRFLQKEKSFPKEKKEAFLKEKRKFLKNKIKNQSLQAESERERVGFACRLL